VYVGEGGRGGGMSMLWEAHVRTYPGSDVTRSASTAACVTAQQEKTTTATINKFPWVARIVARVEYVCLATSWRECGKVLLEDIACRWCRSQALP